MKTTSTLIVFLVIVLLAGAIYILRPAARRAGDDIKLNYAQDQYGQATVSPLTQDPLKPTMPQQDPLKPQSEISPQEITPIHEKVAITIKTNKGDIDVELDGTAAPFTVGNFVYLAEKNFYDATTFHRVIPDFMIQGGDPLSKDPAMRPRHGTGGPEYRFKDEFNSRKIVRGEIAMANSGPDTNGSQFFIVTGAAFSNLDGKHTNFGTVTMGMDVADAISHVPVDGADNPIDPVIITDIVVK